MNVKFAMRYFAPSFVLCLMGAAPLTVVAQNDGVDGPPKVLTIVREYTKPGKGGSPHEKSESAFVAAAKAGKAPFHYLAMTSLSGPDRALFLSGFSSFAAWEAEEKAVDKIPALGAALDRANVADGDLLSATDESVWVRADELSLKPTGITGARYMQITQYMVKPGHSSEFEEATKMAIAAYTKSVPMASYSTFRGAYGVNSTGYIVIRVMKSMTERDESATMGPAYREALGADGLKKMSELMSGSVESLQTNLFHFSPKMSVPMDAWVTAEPDYWKPKAATAAKKVEAKPAQ